MPWFTFSAIDRGYQVEFNDSQIRPTPVTAAGTPFFQQGPVFDTIPGKAGSHAATITAFPDGELLAAWYSYDGPGELDGAAIYMARRPAGQTGWGPPYLFVDRPEGDGNPVLYSEQDRVWFFQAVVPFGWSTAHIETQRSQDRGLTWSEPTVLTDVLGSNVRYPPVRTTEGRLLLPAYNELLNASRFYQSADGQDWEDLGTVDAPASNIQPSVARLPDGRLLAVMRSSSGRLWVMGSANSGRNWSPPMDSGFPNPNSAACLLALAGGNLLLVFNDSPASRNPLSVAVSADQGLTWSVRKVIAQGDGGYSYPSAIQTSDDMIQIVYSVGRERIEHLTLNEAWLADPAALASGP